MAESLNVKQIASAMNAVVNQATGKSALAAITAGDFTSVAPTALLNGYDPVMNAISQMADRGLMTRNELRQILNLAPLPEPLGSQIPARGEYYDVTDTTPDGDEP